jgi:hypothetical protein
MGQIFCNTGVNKILKVIDKFYKFILLFNISAPTDTRQFILIL